MVFKSRPFRFDTFDWSADYLRLPEPPTALASFGGRLYVFTLTGVYVVDPDRFYIEDYFPGGGCAGPRSVCMTEIGIFFADVNNVYLVRGNELVYVGNPIRSTLTADGESWTSADHAYFDPILTYSSKLKQVHCTVSYNDLRVHSWCYHIPSKRWDYWLLNAIPVSDTVSVGTFTGRDGQLYYSNATSTVEVAGNTSGDREPINWISKKFTANTPSQVKKWYKLIARADGEVAGSSVLIVSVAKDSGAFFNLLSEEVPAVHREAMDYQVKVTAAGVDAGDIVLYSLTWLVRPLVGLR